MEECYDHDGKPYHSRYPNPCSDIRLTPVFYLTSDKWISVKETNQH